MKKIISLIFPIFLLISTHPVFANTAETNEIKIKYDFSAQDMLDSSSAKISSIYKSKTIDPKHHSHSLYRKEQSSIEFIEDDYSIIFPVALDSHFHFGKNKFQTVYFHLEKKITWLPWREIKPQIEHLFQTLSSNSNLTKKSEQTIDLCCPVKIEDIFLLGNQKWHSENFVIHAVAQRSNLPKSVHPRNEDLYRLVIYVTSKVNPIYTKD